MNVTYREHLVAPSIGAALIAAILFLPGCSNPGLLISLVSTQRELVETELSRDSLFARDKIALIDVSGVLMNSESSRLFGSGEHSVSLLLEQLQMARRDRLVKAVILRINSPGGSVVASELMHNEIMHFRKTGKPVVAVMMDVAASGGYYIACACDEIIAQPSTVTGSIGVVMQMFDLSGTMKLIGAKSDAIISGEFKDAGSPLRSMRPQEREIFQQIVLDMYERFVDVVVAGRKNLDEKAVRRLGDGRIYSASQALEAGLIDRIAPLREAVTLTKSRAGLDRVRLVRYGRPTDYRPTYYSHAPHPTGGDVNLFNLDLSGWASRATPRFMYLWSPLEH